MTNLTNLTNGGRVTAIPTADERLELTVTSEIGDALVELTPAEATAIGAAILSWGMAQPWRAFGAACRRAAQAVAEATAPAQPTPEDPTS